MYIDSALVLDLNTSNSKTMTQLKLHKNTQ